MILTDTGPLVALLNRNDPNHVVCAEAAKALPPEPLITTWPCFTEAMYLLHRAGGYAGQLGTRRVFTLDRDFYIYRFADGTVVEVVP